MASSGFDYKDFSSLGNILVRQGSVTKKQLARARAHQEKSGDRIGDILISMNVCTQDEVNEALVEQRRHRPEKSNAVETAKALLNGGLDKVKRSVTAFDTQELTVEDLARAE